VHQRLHVAVLAAAAALAAAPLTAHAAPGTADSASASFQVTTVPAGSEAGWSFTLVGPGTPMGGEHLESNGVAPTTFATPLQAGMYTIAQSTRPGWDQTSATGCVFTVAYPADADHAFTCSVSDTKEGRVTVGVTHTGSPPSGADAFHFVLSGGPDDVLLTQVAGASNGGNLDFGLVRPGEYVLCQQVLPAGWTTSFVSTGGIPNAGGDICLPFTLAPGQVKAFKVDTTSPAPTPSPTPAPTLAPTPSPSSGVQGVIGIPATGGGVAAPTGDAGLSVAMGLVLLPFCGALVAWGRRRR